MNQQALEAAETKTVFDNGGAYRVDERYRRVSPGDVRVEYCIINKATSTERIHWTPDRVYLFLLCDELNKERASITAEAVGERVVMKNHNPTDEIVFVVTPGNSSSKFVNHLDPGEELVIRKAGKP